MFFSLFISLGCPLVFLGPTLNLIFSEADIEKDLFLKLLFFPLTDWYCWPETGNNSTEWAGILSFKNRHDLLKYRLETWVHIGIEELFLLRYARSKTCGGQLVATACGHA